MNNVTIDDFVEMKCKVLGKHISDILMPYIENMMREAYDLGKSEDADILADPFPNSIETEQPYVEETKLEYKASVDPYFTYYQPNIKPIDLSKRHISVDVQDDKCYYDETNGQPMKVMGMVCHCKKCTATC
jgi:hypothetical protein